jgi:eukaryotic-like serine/threonine-protein kinase
MHKKNIYILTLIFALALSINSCKKTFSDDSPLPITYKPSVLVPAVNNTLYSLDAATGLKNWEFKTKLLLSYTPVVAWDSLAMYAEGDSLFAINAQTGKRKWAKNYSGEIRESFYYYNSKLYIAIKKDANDSIFQLDNSGAITWRNSVPSEIKFSPIIANNLMYITAANNKIFCLDPFGPNWNPLVWSFNTGNTIQSNITAANGFLYAMVGSQKLLKIDALTGTPIWPFFFPAAINKNAAPIVYSDMILLGCDDFSIYCIDATSGLTIGRWVYPTNDRIQGSACVNVKSENIIIGSNDFNLYAINHVDGKLRWKFPTASIINRSPVDYNGNVIFTSVDKYCYCVNATTGKLVWKYNLDCIASASPMVCTFAGANFYPAELGNSTF